MLTDSIQNKDKLFIVDKVEYLLVFEDPLTEIETYNYDEIKVKLEEIEKFVSTYYLAGFISYEAGYPLIGIEPKSTNLNLPLIWFGVFNKPKIVGIQDIYSHQNFTNEKKYSISNLVSSLSYEDYEKKIDKIKHYIKNGYTYQTNFTFKIFFEFRGDPFSLFLDLRKKQTVKYGRFVKYKDFFILSVSPELFFRVKDKFITTKPMKGTIRRGRFIEEDYKLSKKLFLSEKNRAENLMIVDLLRNDLGVISEFGTVAVEKMFEIEKYETVFQMTSTIKGKLKENITFKEIIEGIFPGGSITGAPKKKTMEIIKETETDTREIYTGTIGYTTPDGYSEFNIAIRTPVIFGEKGEIGIGSGITWYSATKNEYEECILKSNFLVSKPTKEFQLIESILLKNTTFYLLPYHLNRLKKSAKFFSFYYDEKLILSKLSKIKNLDGVFKVRLLLSRDGSIFVEVKDIVNPPKEGNVKIAEECVNSNDVFLYHKTTVRDLYDYYYSKSKSEKLIDYIFRNEKGEITEGTIHNIIIVKNNNLITPCRKSGLLRGTMLEYLSKKYRITEKKMYIEDLKSADKILLCNSVSGIKKVKLVI